MGHRMTSRIAMLAALAALALPASAGAGGFATVGLGSLPDGTAPGTPWHVELTILQHGRGPLSDLSPTIRIRSADGRSARTFAARPAGEPGVYRADVVFPRAGRWTYVVDDGFSLRHTFAPVAIGSSRAIATPGASGSRPAAPAPAREAGSGSRSGSGASVGAALAAAAIAGLLAALLSAALLRRRHARAAAAPVARP